MKNKSKLSFIAHASAIFVLLMLVASTKGFGQWGCGDIGLTANPGTSTGCATTITYTFDPGGMQVVSTPSWEISGDGIQTEFEGLTTTVTWSGGNGTRYVRVRYPVFENGSVVDRCSEKSYTIASGNPGTISGGPGTICPGGSGTFSLTGNSAGTLTWQRCITGCSSTSDEGWTTHTSNSFSSLSVTTSFRVKLVAACGAVYSNTRTVVVEPLPSAGFMNFIQGSATVPSGGGGVQFELTGYSSNADLIRWQMQVAGGTWQDVNAGFQQGHYRYPISGPHLITQQTNFRAIAKSGSDAECESDSPGIALQSVGLSNPPPPPPSPDLTGPTTSVCKEKFHTYTLSDPDQDITNTFQTSWSISGNGYEVLPDNYQTGATYHSIQVKWLGGTQGTVTVNYHSAAHNITGVQTLNVSLLTPGTLSITASPEGTFCSQAEVTLTASGGTNYSWSGPGVTSSSQNPIVVNPVSMSHYTVTGIETVCNISKSATKTIEVSPLPANPPVTTLTYCVWEQPKLKIENDFSGSYNWYNANGALIGNGLTWNLPLDYLEGSSTYQSEAVDVYGCASAGRATVSLTVTSNCDERLNWIETKSFDHNRMLSNDRKYFDYIGVHLQSQHVSFQTNKIFLNQEVHDRYDRVVGETLPAPSTIETFRYQYKFAWSNGRPYSYKDIDNPENPATILNPLPVNDETPGSLGWYYSANNTWESNVPVTDFPYSRFDTYEDGTNEVKRTAGVGDIHRLGGGYEVLSGTFPLFNELDDYLNVRRNAVGLTDKLGTVNSLVKKGIQSVVMDENGKYSISISDQSGNVVMSARKGTSQNHVLSVPVSINATVVSPNDPDFRPLTYFYILDEQTVNISGAGSYVIENIVTGDSFNPPASNVWPAGFYRIILSSGSVNLNYSNHFLDVAYQFYDDAGRLKISLSPNGYTQMKNNGGKLFDGPLPPPSMDLPPLADFTLYKYNHQGWLISMIEPDAGATKYKYRKDGKIRFSQNAEQATTAKQDFSYTLYDKLGRPVESGEYYGMQHTFASLDAQLEYGQQINFVTDKRDWIKTYYDTPAAAIPNLPASTFIQNFVRGAVSWTENVNIETWYSYDELGRVVWMAQRPKLLNKTFVTQYTYDFTGNVVTVQNSMYDNGNAINPFYHHYEYDVDNRLSKAFTSTDGSNKKLRATYEYYLHGPLKRIELGDQLQGIDFVYNIQGWLTQINHPDPNLDPGKDGQQGGRPNVRADVFGMVLDYYESSMTGLYTAGVSPTIQNLNQLHGLPNFIAAESLASHQPLIRFSPIQDPSPVSSNPKTLKEFSAENPRYKQMLSTD